MIVMLVSSEKYVSIFYSMEGKGENFATFQG